MTTKRDKDSDSGLARTDFGLAMGECTVLPFMEGLPNTSQTTSTRKHFFCLVRQYKIHIEFSVTQLSVYLKIISFKTEEVAQIRGQLQTAVVFGISTCTPNTELNIQYFVQARPISISLCGYCQREGVIQRNGKDEANFFVGEGVVNCDGHAVPPGV